MKSILIMAFSLLSLNAFAGPGDTITSDPVIETVYDQICSDDALAELGITGTADISFTVDAEGFVHVQEIQSNDFLLQYHLTKVFEGMKVSASESIVGKTFSFIMNVVQPD